MCRTFVSLLCIFFAQPIHSQEVVKPSLRAFVRHTSNVLTCPFSIPEQLEQHVTWYFTSMDKERIKPVSNGSRFLLDHEGKSLMIRNVSTEDAGMFICCYPGPCYDTFLSVLDFENILSFTYDGVNQSAPVIISSKGGFTITAYHGSPINVDFRQPSHVSLTHHITRTKTSTQYSMEHATLQNSGQIVLRLTFEELMEDLLFTVFIHGQPNLEIESVWSAKQINITWHGVAYPPPLLSFNFIPADEGYSDAIPEIFMQSVSKSNQSIYVRASAVIKLPLPQAGTVRFIASNSEGTSYASMFLGNKPDRIDTSRNQSISKVVKNTSSMRTMHAGKHNFTIIGALVALIFFAWIPI